MDLSSAEVGGTINTSDLTDLPTGNRSYFAAIALLPGVQFRPSTSLGNDTIIVNGQHPNTNNVAVDGAANNDDNSGTWGRRPDARPARVGAGVPGHHQPVRRRVRPRGRRGHQLDHQAGDQRVHRLAVQLLHQQQSHSVRLLRRAGPGPAAREGRGGNRASRSSAASSGGRSSATGRTSSSAWSGSSSRRGGPRCSRPAPS